jgi:outer membrane protein OmpA-like peptidoglycan-associated protein
VREQQELRAQLLAQLNSVLQTVDTPRGLVVTMADILFASGKYELSQDAKLAKLSGVILAHPGLKLGIEGYPDSTGTEALNLTLSGQRADAVRSFLVEQGLTPGDVTSAGMGQAAPWPATTRLLAGSRTVAWRSSFPEKPSAQKLADRKH